MQKGISTLTGIIILVIVALVLFGGVLAYQYYAAKSQIQNPNVQSNPNVSNTQTLGTKTVESNEVEGSGVQMSDDVIIKTIDKLEGIDLKKESNSKFYIYSSPTGTHTINLIAKGDLNGDGLQDAIIWADVCGATCSIYFLAVVNNDNNLPEAFNVVADGILTSSAKRSGVKSIAIKNGIVSINADIFDKFNGDRINQTFNYKLVGKNLVKL